MLARQSTAADVRKRHVILPPRSRRGGARLLCGLYHRHVGHSVCSIHPFSWQVHGISITKKMFLQGDVLWVRRDFVFFNVARPSVRVRSCRMWFHLMKVLFPGVWMPNEKGASGVSQARYVGLCRFGF